MKSFDNIQELWDYCSYCPICKKNSRTVDVSVGPDMVFKLDSFDKKPGVLDMSCSFTNRLNVYLVDYHINCLDNNFDVNVRNVQMNNPHAKIDKQKAAEAYFYFYIQGHCPECTWTWSYGSDLELDALDKTISNITLEREFFYIFTEKDHYQATLVHDRDIMYVSRIEKNEDGTLGETGKSIELPLVKLDVSDQEKVINKIKTLILFS